MSQQNHEESYYCPAKGRPLPALTPFTRHLLRFYGLIPITLLKKWISIRLKIPPDVDFQPGFRCTSGKLFFTGPASLSDTLFVDYGSVHLGHNVGFSFRNIVITSTHEVDDFSRIITKPVTIGDNVWITSNVTILPGITIGDNSIIGAGSVVTKDIPPNCFAAGNPCKVIRHLK
ncbi:DapH/DapD/GlmU-related protein [Luteolibacter sp. SL250]|uniref:DapH/DapD/GlmU-related protein n=1 Tax=Luteolibacter sp. SL250 TaxID=2995170 RepID=UPI00226D6669|nr:DapH/DapD/GlmU-related protein [Luteolibacter sp. SL250]WAC20445.1 DapH/DapD/GlmU-related protein [Luteolibacter sp. SL250]